VKVEVWREGDFVTIRVSDSGPGAPESVRSKVFDPFFTTKDSGTGLGLAIAHRVVDSHGGRIWVENGEVCGAVFTMELPIAQAVATSNEEAV
jgi:two-component system sensor histidine kinase AtoS